MQLQNKKIIMPAARENIETGDLVYWDCTQTAGIDYDRDVLLHDSDGCEYVQEHIRVATGIVLKKDVVDGLDHRWSYDILCSDKTVRKIPEYSLWIVRK